jgi:hypothetical protein
LQLLAENKLLLCKKSRDDLNAYEIAAGKWNYHSLKVIINSVENEDYLNSDSSSNLHNMDILKSALNIALDRGKLLINKNSELLDLLLKQIKIQYTVDSSKK